MNDPFVKYGENDFRGSSFFFAHLQNYEISVSAIFDDN